MSTLKNKIDFVVLISAEMANPNGDPLNGNRPRTNYEGFGEISDVCIKRKLRNRMQDMGNAIFVQSADRADDGCKSLEERASKLPADNTDADAYSKAACDAWLDVRSFGQVFALKGKKKKKGDGDSDEKGVSIGIRGPVSIHQAVSCSPVEINSMQITKSVNNETSEGRSSDTMGMKHMIRYGIYKIKGSINVQLAEKTGLSEEDVEVIKNAFCTLFENDASAARPDGSMEVVKVFWWTHNCASGQYPSAKVHRLVNVVQKDENKPVTSIEDYEITVGTLPDLSCEIFDGI